MLLFSLTVLVFDVARGGLGRDQQPRGEDTDGPQEQPLQVVRSPYSSTPSSFFYLTSSLFRSAP